MTSTSPYIARPYRNHTNSVSECPCGINRRMRGPRTMKARIGAACPTPYPTTAMSPAQVAASAGLNRIQAPITDATSVAIAAMPPADLPPTM